MGCALSLIELKKLEEAKSLLLNTIPVAQRVCGESDQFTLLMKWHYARTLYKDLGATLDDLREAVTSLEDVERTARRVLGGAHPLVVHIEGALHNARAISAARESSSRSSK